jgi:3-hydroxyisobutyrate dehydrogenase-like beta-hydroxyacid dehydrogenase
MVDNNEIKNIGFIGIGLMGKPMATNLIESKYSINIWNRTKEKANDLIDKGATWFNSPKELAKNSDVVITMVTNSKASKQVSCGENGILKGAHKGLILIDMSSIEPEMSRYIAKKAKEKDVFMLDAPVTGNPVVAKKGKLGIMIGGNEEIYKKCIPIFNILGEKLVYVGSENGNGTTLKLINNLILGVAIMASAEALVLANKAGIDPQKVIDITSVGGARTGAMETRGPRMIKRDFSPHFSTNNMYKDLSSALNLADSINVTLPTTSITREMLKGPIANGEGDMDSAIIMTLLENMANTFIEPRK